MTSPSDGPRFHRIENQQLHDIQQQLAEIIALLQAPEPEPDSKTVPIARGAAARSRKKKDALP